MSRPRLLLIRDSFTDRPALDTAVSRALLQLTAAGEMPETLRLHRPGPNVAFGLLDALTAGYAAAVAAARASGFEAVERLAGGRAAVYHEDTVGIAHTVPDADAAARTYERFDQMGAIVAAALAELGVDARVGAVPGEYCPGAYSVNAGGTLKLVGIGQRIVPGAAHTGGVAVIRGGDRVRRVLVPVYDALGVAWDPATAGSVHEVAPGVTYERAEAALTSSYDERYDLVEATLDPGVLALAEDLEGEHLAPGAPLAVR